MSKYLFQLFQISISFFILIQVILARKTPFRITDAPDEDLSLHHPNATREERMAPITLDQALELVDQQKLEDCVAMVICSLSCDSKQFGEQGEKVFNMLKGISDVKMTERLKDDIKFYKKAQDDGNSLQKNECKKCKQIYSKCRKNIKSLLKMLNSVNISL